KVTLLAIQSLSHDSTRDPFTDPDVLARSVTTGILDAPQLKNNRFGRGMIRTRIINGACHAVDENGNPISELQRLEQFFKSGG
ncbi:MAG: methionine synthase, partial [Chloroflexota bacterium]